MTTIIHSKKFVFLRVPRTASTSLSHFIGTRTQGVIEDAVQTAVPEFLYRPKNELTVTDAVHDTLHMLVYSQLLTEEQVRTYRVFAVMRDPVDRFISVSYHINSWGNSRSFNRGYKTLPVEKHGVNDIVEYYLNIKNGTRPSTGFDFMFLNQRRWLLYGNKYISDIIDYNRLDNGVEKMLKYLNLNPYYKLEFKHRSDERKDYGEPLDPILADRIRDSYKLDVELYSKIKNKVL